MLKQQFQHCGGESKKRPEGRFLIACLSILVEERKNVGEDVADCRAKQEQNDNYDDRDQHEDERVFN
jgi:hypothetical protein